MSNYKLMPVEPTKEMVLAGARHLRIMSFPEREAASVFRAMSAVAPVVQGEQLRYTNDGALAECPCCGSLDVGGAHDTVHCQSCGLTVMKPRPLQNAIDAWNTRTGRKHPAPAVKGEPVAWQCVDRPERIITKLSRRTIAEVDSGVEFMPLVLESGVSALVEALEQIERWDGFPSTDKTWEGSGEPVSYGAAFGSNGERDFMREVARKALAAHRKQGR